MNAGSGAWLANGQRPGVRLWIGVLAVAGVGAAALVFASGDELRIVGGCLLVIAAAAPLWARLAVDPLDAPGLYGLVSAVFLGVMSLEWIGVPPIPAPGIDAGDVTLALGLVAGALFAAGVSATLTERVRTPPAILGRAAAETGARVPGVRVLVGVFALGLVATAVALPLGVISFDDRGSESDQVLAVSQLLRQAASLGGLVVLATALLGFRNNDPNLKRLLLVLVPIQIAVGFIVGFKGLSVLPLLYVALAYIAVYRRIPWRSAGAVLVVSVLILIPANAILRSKLLDQPGAPPITPATVAQRSYETLSSRFRLIDHVALIVARTPSMYPFAGAARYATLPALIAVPRAVWPDKPLLDYGEAFTHTYWEIGRYYKSSTPLTQIGDLYRAFGTAGPLLGLALWGAVLSGLAKLRRRRRSIRIELVYLSSLVVWVTLVEVDLPQLVAAMARAVPVTVLFAWFVLPGVDSPPGYRRLLGSLANPSRPSSKPRESSDATAAT